MEAEKMLSRPIHLGQIRGSKSNRTQGERRQGKKRHWGDVEREYRNELGAQGRKSISAMGHWELRLVLNVLQPSQSRDNNIGWFINLITVPCQTPVSVFTPLLISHFPQFLIISLPLCFAGQQTTEARWKKVTLTFSKQCVWQWPTHNQENGD